MNKSIESLLGMLSCLSLVCISALLAIEANAGGAAQSGTSAATPAMLYQSYCSVCHGDHGDGQSRARGSLNPPPSDFTSPAVRANLPRERMIASVREGRPGTAMVGWKTQLTDAQIAVVVDYVRDKFMGANGRLGANSGQKTPPASLAMSVAGAAPVQTALKGDQATGARLYAQNCVACHGQSGDGNGPRAYFIMPRPRNFISAESRAIFSRPVLISAIAKGKLGTEMPSWEKVLSAQEIADVAEFVFQRFITNPANSSGQDRK